jgi:hypothetical protein
MRIFKVHTRRENEHRQEHVRVSAWGSRDNPLLSGQNLHQFLGGKRPTLEILE